METSRAANIATSTYRVLFVAGIEHLHIDASLGRGERVGDTFFITNDTAFVQRLLSHEFMQAAGGLEGLSLAKLGAIAYAFEDVQPFEDDHAANAHLLLRLGQVGILLQMLWFVRDNAATTELGYLEHPYQQPSSSLTRNFFSTIYSTATGSHETVTFSRDELRRARELYALRSAAPVKLKPQSAVEDIDRWARAFYFLQGARSQSDLAIKISNYCTCFEALFATDPQELTHKLAERVACFLESDGEARLRIFREVKTAYSIRSKTVHGAKGASDLATVQRSSVASDELIRRCLRKIWDDPELRGRFMNKQPAASMEEYLLSLVLTPPATVTAVGPRGTADAT